MPIKVSFIIAAHNEGDNLTKTLASLVESINDLDYEIVVADDASTDGAVRKSQREFPRVRVVQHRNRLGTSATKALGADQAPGLWRPASSCLRHLLALDRHEVVSDIFAGVKLMTEL
jgi:N-acetylglucosaminyl-diphospho-decaprenol L-rhamnosyltransferase